MDLDDDESGGSLTVGILKAFGQGLTLVFLGLTAKVLLSGSAVPVGELMTILVAGMAGTACLIGGAVADRECSSHVDEEEAACCQTEREPCIAATPPGPDVAEGKVAAGGERRFTSMVEQERQGRGVVRRG